jgi:hypothetical protein
MDHEAEMTSKEANSENTADRNAGSGEMRVSRREISREEREALGNTEEGNKEPLVGSEERKLVKYMANAQLSYRASKEAAMETVSQLYMLWQATLSKAKSEGAKAWLESEVKILNTEIEKHNKNESLLSTRMKSIADGKTTLDKEYPIEGKSEAEIKIIEEQKQLFVQYSSLDSRERSHRRKIMVDFTDKAGHYTNITRFGLRLLDGIETDVVSRYAKVLWFVCQHHIEEAVEDPVDIVAWLKAHGGFEACLRRAYDFKSDEDSQEKDDERIINEDADEYARSFVAGMPAKAAIVTESKFANDGYVLMVGRVNGGVTEVLGEVPTTENEVKRAVLHLSDDANIPTNDNCEFFARVMALSEIIKEGDDSGLTRDNTESGQKLKGEKSVVIRKDEAGRPLLVVSKLYSESSAVIYARPKAWNQFDQIHSDVYLSPKNITRVGKDLSSLAKRRRIDYSFNLAPMTADGKKPSSPISMEARYAALEGKPGKNPIKQYYWYALAPKDHKPVDVDHFDPQFTAELDIVRVVELINYPYKEWLGLARGDKNRTNTDLTFNGRDLTIQITGVDPYTVQLEKDVGGKFKLTFNSRELFDLFSRLEGQHTEKFIIKGDEAGLMAISWEDKIAHFAVHQPMVNAKGQTITRRLAPMRVKATVMEAAE